MSDNATKLKSLIGQTFTNLEVESGASAYLFTANGIKVYISYWRLCSSNESKVSSFDDKQKYGSATPIDSLKLLKEAILNIEISSIKLTDSFSDIEIKFTNNVIFQIFNFTGNEVWEVTFRDGTSILSNYL